MLRHHTALVRAGSKRGHLGESRSAPFSQRHRLSLHLGSKRGESACQGHNLPLVNFAPLAQPREAPTCVNWCCQDGQSPHLWLTASTTRGSIRKWWVLYTRECALLATTLCSSLGAVMAPHSHPGNQGVSEDPTPAPLHFLLSLPESSLSLSTPLHCSPLGPRAPRVGEGTHVAPTPRGYSKKEGHMFQTAGQPAPLIRGPGRAPAALLQSSSLLLHLRGSR